MSALDYASYLQLDSLLDLQRPASPGPAHDETLFIVVHQVHELWFKQLLHEGDASARALREDQVAVLMPTLRRMCCVLKVLVGQVDVLETMTPQAFNAFRGHLQSASGFQSVQFRSLEMLMGQRRGAVLAAQPAGSAAQRALMARFEQPGLFDLLLRALARHGFAVPAAVLRRDVREALRPSAEVQAALAQVYRASGPWAQVCERLVDLDEGFQEWRYRHVQMVQRIIGSKRGTGGSAGADYLRRTLFSPFFADLWEVRAAL